MIVREQRMLAQLADPAQRATVAQALQRHRRPDRIAPGDLAPDVALPPLDDPEGPPVRPRELARSRGRPVVLCFGSYT